MTTVISIKYGEGKSTLHVSPFVLLGVTSRDDRRKIYDQAELMSLGNNSEDCLTARSGLTNPRKRLSIEMAWLPGISPTRAKQFLDSLVIDPMSIRKEKRLPTLAHCNLMAAAFEAINNSHSVQDIAEFIQELAVLINEININELVMVINEDRSISGFPEIKSSDQVEEELDERKRYFRSTVKDALNRLPSVVLLNTLTRTVDLATKGGEVHAPELVDELIDAYAVEVQGVLEKEAENINKLIAAVRQAIPQGEKAVTLVIAKLESVIKNWDSFAQPIQLSAKSRGIKHDSSYKLANVIRQLALDIFNKHDLLNISLRLTDLMKSIFAELPDFVEFIEKDKNTLSDIKSAQIESAKKAKLKEVEWASSITFSAEIGLIFKDNLAISINGIAWKTKIYPLDSITAIRWGATRQTTNGVHTGTYYAIGFATRFDAVSISLNNQSTYSGFIDALWRAVGVRLIIEMLETLEAGKVIDFGNFVVEDQYVTLDRHKIFGSNEKVRLKWSEVHTLALDGNLFIGSNSDKKIHGSVSYQNHWNTHLLAHVINAAHEKKLNKLSDYLNG